MHCDHMTLLISNWLVEVDVGHCGPFDSMVMVMHIIMLRLFFEITAQTKKPLGHVSGFFMINCLNLRSLDSETWQQ